MNVGPSRGTKGEVSLSGGAARERRSPVEPSSSEAPEPPGAFALLLRGLGQQVDRGESVVKRAVSGGQEMSSMELLSLQAGVYRYSEAVDLSAKLVDRATSGVKTVLQGQ